MSRTLPQILMLNHASWVNSKRMEDRVNRDRASKEQAQQEDDKDPIVWNGKRLSEMNSDEMAQYYNDW